MSLEEVEKTSDPLLACLQVVAAHHGCRTTPEALLSGLPLPDGQLTPSLFPRAAARVGLSSALLRRALEHIDGGLLPAVLLLRDDEACVLLATTPAKGEALIVYPDLPEVPVQTKLDELQRRYTGVCLLSGLRQRMDARTEHVEPAREGHWFWSALRAHVPLYRDVLLAAALVNTFALAMPLFSMNVYDRVVPNHAMETLWVLAAGICIVLMADSTLRTMRSYFLDLAGRRVDIDLSARLMEKVLGLRMEARPASTGSFASNLRSFESVRDFITSATMTAVIDVPFALIFCVAITWIAWPLMIPLLLGAGAVAGYAWFTQARMRALTQTTHQAGAMRNSVLIECLVGLETLKALGAEGLMQRKWERTGAFLARTAVKVRLLGSSNVNLTLWVQQLVSVATIVVGVYRITTGDLTMGALIASSMLVGRAMAPLAQVSALLTQYHNAMASLASLDEIMARPVERPTGATFISRPRLHGEIEFRNVSFGYPNQGVPVVRHVSFRIRAGERVAILGRVGSGKTTLQKLITGLYLPTEGAVLIDGIDVRQLDPAELRRQVGFVPQDVTLFYGSLRENLCMAHPQASDDDVLRVSAIAGLSDFVNQHPRGYELNVGERGEALSGGQRKCVALARALIHDPPILLMDEPTGSMDHSTEATVKERLACTAQGKTFLVVTHRTSLLDLVDRVMVMDGGQFVADGPKAEVVEALRQRRISKAIG